MQCTLSCPILTKTRTSRQIAVRAPTPNFTKSCSRIVTRGKTDMEKLRATRNITTFICESTRGEGIRLIHPWIWKRKICNFPFHVTKAYGGSRHIVPVVLNLGTIRKWVINITPRPQSRSGHFGEAKEPLPNRVRSPERPACSVANIPNTLTRFSSANHNNNKKTPYLQFTNWSFVLSKMCRKQVTRIFLARTYLHAFNVTRSHAEPTKLCVKHKAKNTQQNYGLSVQQACHTDCTHISSYFECQNLSQLTYLHNTTNNVVGRTRSRWKGKI